MAQPCPLSGVLKNGARVGFSPFIIQKISVRLLRRPLVCAQVKVTGGDQPVVPQDVLDMPNGAAVKEERRRYCVAQHVRGHGFWEADHFSESPEPNERRVESQRSPTPAYHEERLALVITAGHVLLDPIERPRAEK